MELVLARTIAEKCATSIASGCRRVEIAGGIRRGKQDPHDIELVVMPDLRPPHLTFGKPFFSSVFDAVMACVEIPDDDGFCMHRVLGQNKFQKYQVSFDGGHTSQIMLDLFIVTPPAEFGLIYLLRTGPADFSHWLVTKQFKGGALPNEYTVFNGAILDTNGKVVPTPEEIDVLKLIRLGWIEPKDRHPRWQRSAAKLQSADAIFNGV